MSEEGGVTPSEETVHVSPMEVTPTLGKGTLGVRRDKPEVGDERASRERTSDPLGPESCAVTARDAAKHRQGYRRGGYRVAKIPNQDADDMPRRGRQYGQGR